MAVRHQVDRPPCRRCHHWHTRCERLLHCLTERLVESGVSEDIERCVELTEFGSSFETDERRSRQAPFQLGALGAIADDDHAHTGQTGDRSEAMDLLLLGQPPDVTDDQFAIRGKLPVQHRAAMVGVEALQVDTAHPPVDALDAVRTKGPRRRRRGREGHIGVAMNPPQPSPEGRACGTDAVALGESDDVGLEDRHHRDVEVLRGSRCPSPEHRGCC